jgi:hypothetical protein
MLWLVLGIVVGFAWHWFLTWSRARGIRISWGVWFFLIWALIAALSGVQNYVALLEEYEERAAWMTIPVYTLQTLVFGLPALLLLWRQVRMSKKPA